MARTELLYFVQNTVDEAEAAGRAGFASMVLVSAEDRLFEVQWVYGEDQYPMLPCGRA